MIPQMSDRLFSGMLRDQKSQRNRPAQSKIPNDFAMRLVNFDPLYSALDIVEIATETKRSAEKVSLMAK